MAGLIGGSSSKTLRVQEFRASGTFTVPSGVKTVSLFMVGAGGGIDGGYRAGQGGNVVEVNYDVSGKASCAVVIGAGVSGGDGGDTTFDGVVIAKGGVANGAYWNAAVQGQTAPMAGKNGFGGHGQMGNGFVGTVPLNAVNGARTGQAGSANTGAGASGSAAQAGGSGYCRVEWYE